MSVIRLSFVDVARASEEMGQYFPERNEIISREKSNESHN